MRGKTSHFFSAYKLHVKRKKFITMKSIMSFFFPYKDYTYRESMLLLWLRVIFGVLFMLHGIAKMKYFSEIVGTFPNPLGLGSEFTLYCIIFVEVACSVLIVCGALFRIALIPSIFSMLIAFFVVHSGEGFAAKELALIYLLMFLIFFRMGAGSYSLDSVIARRMYIAEL